MAKFSFKKLYSKAKKGVKTFQKNVKNKRQLVNSLTNKELEMIWKKYIDRNLSIEYITPNNKRKKRKPTRTEMKRKIFIFVPTNNIMRALKKK